MAARPLQQKRKYREDRPLAGDESGKGLLLLFGGIEKAPAWGQGLW